MGHLPLSTYRIQFTPRFGFRDAIEIAGYLKELGISDLYASPVFKARSGSGHGYDVVDPTRLNPELGTEEDFSELVRRLRVLGMGWLQDIVPNHMAFHSENTMLMDVLENGKRSRYYRFFDIDWDHSYQNLRGRVLAPFLGRVYSECLENGEIRLEYVREGFFIRYYTIRFPLKIDTYFQVFDATWKGFEERLGANHPEVIRLLGTLSLFKSIPEITDPDTRERQIGHTKEMLWTLYEGTENIRAFMDETLACMNGKKGEPDSFESLDRLLSEQLFRLAFWKVAAEEINYRRFFTVNDLISVKVEDDAIFDATHKLIRSLVDEGAVRGLRVDHIDGLRDPAGYLERLRGENEDLYLVVEKILEYGENLPGNWPIQGTTGYDFLNYANGLFCDTENAGAFSKIYYKFTGRGGDYEELLHRKKRMIIARHLAGNIDNLALEIKAISSRDRYGRDITLYGLRRALVEVMALFPVYRTYIDPGRFSDDDRRVIRETVERARCNMPAMVHELRFIEKFFLGDETVERPPAEVRERIRFVMHFQQYTGALMAKGFEDTFLYIYNRLVSLNEVGGFPDHFGVAPRDLHAFLTDRAAKQPHTQNATASHDTKRGEDVRARINVLSESPLDWEANLKHWSRLNRRRKKRVRSRRMPDKNDEYFLYQTLIGTVPFEGVDAGFIERIKQYVIKAVREAKVHTNWITSDAEYEEAFLEFIDRVLKPVEDNSFLKEFLPYQERVADYGILNSLSQVLLKAAAPGLPDFYQGTELWDFSLVDPDNRRPVDYAFRARLLDQIRKAAKREVRPLVRELWEKRVDGRIKLFLVMRVLEARTKNRAVFDRGSYLPLSVEGERAEHLFAFARRSERSWAVAVVPRLCSKLVPPGTVPVGAETWKDTRILLPRAAPREWKDALIETACSATKDALFAADLFTDLPVALLSGEM